MNDTKHLVNRRNALRSTGPKTAAGKARSKLNAMKHGAYAKVLLEGEDESRFKELLLTLLAEYNPVGFQEKLVVHEIAQTIWRKNRFKAAEAMAIHSYSFFKQEGEEERGNAALAIAQDASAYGVIPRCLTAEELLDRRLWKLFDRLTKLQKKRRRSAAEEVKQPQKEVPIPDSDGAGSDRLVKPDSVGTSPP